MERITGIGSWENPWKLELRGKERWSYVELTLNTKSQILPISKMILLCRLDRFLGSVRISYEPIFVFLWCIWTISDLYFTNGLLSLSFCFLTGFSMQTPLVYNYGDPAPDTNKELYTQLMSRLSEVVFKHFDQNEKGILW